MKQSFLETLNRFYLEKDYRVFESLFDEQAFINYIAVESAIGVPDGVIFADQNYYLYQKKSSQKYWLIPWGIDRIFVNHTQSVFSKSVSFPKLMGILINNPIFFTKLVKQIRYLQKMGVINEQEILDRVEFWRKKVELHLPAYRRATWPQAMIELQSSIKFNIQRLDRELSAVLP